MVKVILLYVLFICINFGWGMLATGLIEVNATTPTNSPCDGFGEPVCTYPQPCPADGVAFDDTIHHKLCSVGIQTPDALRFDAKSQSPDVSGVNNPATSTTLLTRNVTGSTGTVYEVLVDDTAGNNQTGIQTGGTTFDTGGFGDEFFSFIEDTQRIAGFGATIFFDTFTGGFVLDVLGTGILGVDYPQQFLDGVKILIGLSIVSYFGYLFIGKPLLE